MCKMRLCEHGKSALLLKYKLILQQLIGIMPCFVSYICFGRHDGTTKTVLFW